MRCGDRVDLPQWAAVPQPAAVSKTAQVNHIRKQQLHMDQGNTLLMGSQLHGFISPTTFPESSHEVKSESRTSKPVIFA